MTLIRSQASVLATGLGLCLAAALASQAWAEASAPAPPRRPPQIDARPRTPARADRFAGWVSIEPRRWPGAAVPSPASLNTSGIAAPDACLAALGLAGAVAAPATVESATTACAVEQPVRLQSLRGKVGRIDLAGEPVLACAMALKVAEFVAEVAEPLLLGMTGSPLRRLHVGGGHECRPRNRVPGAKMSAHGRGLALDIMAVELADGRRIPVTAATTSGAGAPLEGLRAAACGYFLTVLGPGADAAHDDHLHLDMEQHGRSAMTRLCQ